MNFPQPFNFPLLNFVLGSANSCKSSFVECIANGKINNTPFVNLLSRPFNFGKIVGARVSNQPETKLYCKNDLMLSKNDKMDYFELKNCREHLNFDLYNFLYFDESHLLSNIDELELATELIFDFINQGKIVFVSILPTCFKGQNFEMNCTFLSILLTKINLLNKTSFYTFAMLDKCKMCEKLTLGSSCSQEIENCIVNRNNIHIVKDCFFAACPSHRTDESNKDDIILFPQEVLVFLNNDSIKLASLEESSAVKIKCWAIETSEFKVLTENNKISLDLEKMGKEMWVSNSNDNILFN